MKKLIFTFSLSLLLSVHSCRENNPKAVTPEDTQQMEGVRKSKEEAMDREKELTSPDYQNPISDSLAQKDSVTKNRTLKDKAPH